MSGRYPDWAEDGADWPNRAASQFIDAAGYRWHIQRMGPSSGAKRKRVSVCLLIHGTGAATHSWRDVMPLLAQNFDVIAVDLPGHGFTHSNIARTVSLPGMAASVAALLTDLDVTPDVVVGHSAGVAIGAQLLLDQGWQVPLIGFAPALMPFPGLAAKIFPTLAKMLFTNPFVSIIFSRIARGAGETTKFLARSTGSAIDRAGDRFYTRLFSRSGHCDGAIRMMANWQLEPLRDRLSAITAPVLLVRAGKDVAIPASAVQAAADLIPGCVVQEMSDLGHLAHEEDPIQASDIIVEFAKAHRAN